ncbi:peptidyl-prolyl cis-trans isomerase [Mongoliitalea daihaiensis]|uniref:peptidyl-prolyl cis-trans isomerase n=1 Tax=Mongoliitalea daihaiensis TaxID=2782006 RepID=UPI001F47C8AD|nr:peptidyl-prolyl cis-trans isomerase [Mongoliitalea daihaiensis]UJP67171.1 peptidyl-prolyl cis-trans isomerase [Mongoliitalea daihaiensis]
MKKIRFTKKSFKISVSLVLVLSFVSACDLFRVKSGMVETEDRVLATVGNNSLMNSEVSFLINTRMSAEDSAAIVSRYVQSWVRQQLMITEASKEINFNTPEFNQRIKEYRESLMIHEFEKNYINRQIDQEITEQEIIDYYDLNKGNFTLKETIVRGNFIKLEKTHPQRATFERAIRQKEYDRLQELSLKFASNYYLENGTWVRFEELTANTPLEKELTKTQLLKSSSFIKAEDTNYFYYFDILEYKLQNEVPPMEFVKEEIMTILLNKRVNNLREQLHKDIFTRALENKEFSIYE